MTKEQLLELKELYYQLEKSEELLDDKKVKLLKLEQKIIDIEWDNRYIRHALFSIIRQILIDE